MDKEKLGKFIAETRKEKKMTQQQLAARLHVTDKAVSKWERGLCYPDLTLLEDIAGTLDLSLTQLITCQKESEGDLEIQASSLLEVAGETQRKQKQKMWRLTVCGWALSALIFLGILLCLLVNDSHTDYVYFVDKQSIGTELYVYMEKDGHLLTLHCADQMVYDSIVIWPRQYYDVTYSYNRINYRGTLDRCVPSNALGTPEDIEGSSIGVDSLLGVDCVYMEYTQVYPFEDGYLYTLTYFYFDDGENYDNKNLEERKLLLQVEDCQNTVMEDYDADGVVELIVLTKYNELPYRIYDLEGAGIISHFVENVPESISNRLHMGY